MINRDSRGHSYFIVRGEILGFMKDEQLRKHLPRMFSLIKNESWGLEDDQIPSYMVARLKLKGIDGRAPPGTESSFLILWVVVHGRS
uniref:Uncharacterized protein n=1 Tax=Avena sativa TaxID=4498 RepID=A0ACD5VFM9_AVESA